MQDMDLTSWRVTGEDNVVLSIHFTPVDGEQKWKDVSYKKKSPSNIKRDNQRILHSSQYSPWSSKSYANFDSGYHPSHILDAETPPFVPAPGIQSHKPNHVQQSTPVVQETTDVLNTPVTGCPKTPTKNNSEEENRPAVSDNNDAHDDKDNYACGGHDTELKKSDDNDAELLKEMSKMLISMKTMVEENTAKAMEMNTTLDKYNKPP